MRRPFEKVPRGVRPRLFVALRAAALLVLVIRALTVAPMSDEQAPLSVPSFGVAWGLGRAREMISSRGGRAAGPESTDAPRRGQPPRLRRLYPTKGARSVSASFVPSALKSGLGTRACAPVGGASCRESIAPSQ